MAENFVIIGGSGYIGRELSHFIKLNNPDKDLVSLGSKDLDLTDEDSGEFLDKILNEKTILFICAGIKKQLGDSKNIFKTNISMVQNILRSNKVLNCRKTVFLSSAEVYGENIDDLNISESTICSPSSYYGLAKKHSEELLQITYQKASKSNLVLARMPLVYGPRETQNIYGPSGFLQNAINNQIQTLWGDGSEKRNFLFIEDLINILYHIGLSNFNGVINVANSESNTFRDIINELNSQKIKILLDEKPRSKLKVDQGYDISLLHSIYPNHKSYSLKDGIEKMLATQKEKVQL